MDRSQIIHGERLKETIREELRRALSQESVTAGEATEFYLVNLLTDFHGADCSRSIEDEGRPIGIRFMEALSQGSGSKARELKEIGDSTLIVLGLFAESVRRSIVDESYYMSIGGSAYEALSGVLVCDAVFARIYAELACKFAAYVGVLARIAPWNRAHTETDILNLYRRWVETGDEKLAEELRSEGIALDR
ncbi:MAG: hypothetical protein JXA24_03115 [Proteobacteria bacterium]|nr:hypothetical protein [Pseudomonadota bacterium]